MSSLAYIGGLVLILSFVALVAGIAICSHFDLSGDDDDCHP